MLMQSPLQNDFPTLLLGAPKGRMVTEALTREGFAVVENAVVELGEQSTLSRTFIVLADLDLVCPNEYEALESLALRDRSDDAMLVLLASGGECTCSCEMIRERADFELVKPVSTENLVSIVKAARDLAIQRQSLRQDVLNRSSAIGNIVAGSFEIRTPEHARNLATMLSIPCPEPDQVAVGLIELMLNAIEHGNLEIGYDLKTELLETGRWVEEIERRLSLDCFRDRVVRVDFEKSPEDIAFQITDEGPGFDPGPFRRIRRDALASGHGRGLFIASECCFDEVEFLGRGNVVKARIAGRGRQPS